MAGAAVVRFESAVSTWLHRLAVNTALMELRARRSRPQADDDEDALDGLSTPDTAGRAVLGATWSARWRPCRHARARCWCCTTWKAGSTRKSPRDSAWRWAARRRSCIARAACAHAHRRSGMNEIPARSVKPSCAWPCVGCARAPDPTATTCGPVVAERITALPRRQAQVARSRPRWPMSLATAAALLLAVGVSWKMQPPPSDVAGSGTSIVATAGRPAPLLQREADTLTVQSRLRCANCSPAGSARRLAAGLTGGAGPQRRRDPRGLAARSRFAPAAAAVARYLHPPARPVAPRALRLKESDMSLSLKASILALALAPILIITSATCPAFAATRIEPDPAAGSAWPGRDRRPRGPRRSARLGPAGGPDHRQPRRRGREIHGGGR